MSKSKDPAATEAWRQMQFDRKAKGIEQLTMLLHPGDVKLLAFVQEQLGVNKAEAMRTSLRVYSAILAGIKT